MADWSLEKSVLFTYRNDSLMEFLILLGHIIFECRKVEFIVQIKMKI